MVEYLSRRHSEVVLVVGVNPNKTYDVSPQQRADLLNTMIKSLTSTTATAGSGSIRVAGTCFIHWLEYDYGGTFVNITCQHNLYSISKPCVSFFY